MFDASVKILHVENPLSIGTRKQLTVQLGKRRRVDKFLNEHGLLKAPSKVLLNGVQLSSKDIKFSWLKNGDEVIVIKTMRDPATIEALIVAAQAFAATAVGTALIQIAVAYAINYLIQQLTGPTAPGSGSNAKNEESYGITGGANQYRIFAPFPVVMGKHRIFPDYSSRWIVDYIDDLESLRPIQLEGGYNFVPYAGVGFALNRTGQQGGWENYSQVNKTGFNSQGGNTIFDWAERDLSVYGLPKNPPWGTSGGVYYFGDGKPSSVGVSNFPLLFLNYQDTLIIKWVAPNAGVPWNENVSASLSVASAFAIDRASANFVDRNRNDSNINGAKLRTLKSYGIHWLQMLYGQLSNLGVSDVVNIGKSFYEKTQRLTNIFSYGFGDLEFVDSSHMIGTNKAFDHFGKDLRIERQVYLPAATTFKKNWQHASDAGKNIEWPSDSEAVEGGGLSKEVGKDGPWVSRQTNRKKAIYLELDFSGRLYYSGDNGPQENNIELQIQYKKVSDLNWVDAPVSNYLIRNADLNQVRETIGWDVAQGHYEIRVRSLSDTPLDSRSVQDISLDGHKAFNIDNYHYRGQNRLGVIINASKRISGALNRWSSIAYAKTWVPDNLITSEKKAGGVGWQWKYTDNPAWWLLYATLGGYEDLQNLSPIAHPLHGKYWLLGKLNGVETGQLLFGAGLDHNEIDYASFFEFANYCEVHDLKFGGVVDTDKPCLDVLYDIARIGRGALVWPGGKLGVAFKQQGQQSVQMFGMGNIIEGSFSIDYVSKDLADEVVLTYNDEEEEYGSKQVRAIVPGAIQPKSEAAVNLWGCNAKEQAQREANLIAGEQLFGRKTYSWKADVEGIVCRKWDVVLLAHDLIGMHYSGRLVRMRVQNGELVSVAFDRDLIMKPNIIFWMVSRIPSGQYTNQRFELSFQSGNGFVKAGQDVPVYAGTVSAAACPSILDEIGTENLLTQTTGATTANDYIYHLDTEGDATRQNVISESTGKRVRIVSMKPDGENRVSLSAVDESEDWYATENGIYIGQAKSDSQTILIARAYNAQVIKNDAGEKWLTWETENAVGAYVTSNIFGVNGQLKVEGNELKLSNYPAGAVAQFAIYPTNLIIGATATQLNFSYTY